MTYRIPSPWSPGYAVPGYVKAEGLQTRAFVTKQMPRGTYDQIDDLSTLEPAWAVPQYVKDEGYGQGAYVTQWPPRGYYVGEEVTRHAKRIAKAQRAHGEPVIHPTFAKYGHTTAALILSNIRKLPAPIRKVQLKRALDTIDPTLWQRTADNAAVHTTRGVPASTALELGLSRAMSTGIAGELVKVGKTGQRPPKASLLGLGCYGCGPALQGLGVVPVGAGVSPGSLAVVSMKSNFPPEGACTADGFFIWKGGTWVRRSATDVCTSQSDAQVKYGTGPGGTSVGVVPGQLQVGQWVFANNRGGSYLMTDPHQITAETAAYIRNLLTTVPPKAGAQAVVAGGSYVHDHDVDIMTGAILPYGSTVQRCDWLAALGVPCGTLTGSSVVKNNKGHFVELGTIAGGTPVYWDWFAPPDVADLTWQANYPPIAKFKHPQADEDWGVYLAITAADPKSSYGYNNPSQLKIYAAKIPQAPWYQPILDVLGWLPAHLIDAVTDIVIGIADLGCKLVQAPDATAAGGAVGGPAGAAGVVVSKGLCGGQQPAPTPSTSEDLFLPLAIAGGVVLTAVLLSSRRKRAP